MLMILSASPSCMGSSGPVPPPKSRRCWYYVFGLVLVGIVVYISFNRLTRAPALKDFPPNGSGIGIALSTDFNSISIRRDDGSISTTAQLPVTEDFFNLVRRLNLQISVHPTPPYRSLGESINDRPRQWARNARKNLGYPASADVAIIAQKISDLVVAAEDTLAKSELPLTSAVISLPNALAFYNEDAKNALEYLGIQLLRGHNVYEAIKALPAAYAGYRLGLCTDPVDFESCVREEQQMPRRGVVSVDMNKVSLSVDGRHMNTPMYLFEEDVAVLTWRSDLDDDNWENVRTQIRHAIHEVVIGSVEPPGSKFVYDVLMTGEMGNSTRLLGIVNEIVAEVQDELAEIHIEHPNHIVADGAAELAKRILIQKGRV